MEIIEIIRASMNNFFVQFAEALPRILGAIVLLVIGWLIAKIVKWGIKRLLRAIKFENLTTRLGINNFLTRGGVKSTSSSLIASLFYWLIMLMVLVMFFNSLGLEIVSKLLNDVILFIPNIIVACILFVVGMYLADFVKTLVTTTLRGAESEYADIAGKLARAAVLFFTVSIVLTQLNIGTEIIQTIIQMTLGGLGLALAIAFGLGGKDWAKDMVDKYLRK